MRDLISKVNLATTFWGIISAGFIVAVLTSAQQGPPVVPGQPPAPSPVASGWTDDGATVRLTTDTDNVGIGTAVPAEKLEVNGNIILSGASPIFRITNIADPLAAADAATKSYVDLQVAQAAGPRILRFFSDSIGGPFSTAGGNVLAADIEVDISLSAIVKSARLIFEGILPESMTQDTEGFLEIRKDGGSFIQVLNLGAIFPRGSQAPVPFRLVARDVTSIVTGPGIYIARFGNTTSSGAVLAGNYILEIELE